jgi:hypothetical protein
MNTRKMPLAQFESASIPIQISRAKANCKTRKIPPREIQLTQEDKLILTIHIQKVHLTQFESASIQIRMSMTKATCILTKNSSQDIQLTREDRLIVPTNEKVHGPQFESVSIQIQRSVTKVPGTNRNSLHSESQFRASIEHEN